MNKKADNNFHTISHCSCMMLVGMLKLVADKKNLVPFNSK